MLPHLISEIESGASPEDLVEQLAGDAGVVLLRSRLFESPQARCSFVTARPFLRFRSWGSRCELAVEGAARQAQFGNPWRLLDRLMARCELLDEIDSPFPLGGCFGYWGYDLKNFVEPGLPHHAVNDLEMPDCDVGFYSSLVVFDHRLNQTFVVSTGLEADGSRNEVRAAREAGFWRELLAAAEGGEAEAKQAGGSNGGPVRACPGWISNLTRDEYLERVRRAQEYIRQGDIYQVNVAHRLTVPAPVEGWEFFRRLSDLSPAPFSAWLDSGDFQIASSSPEMFLRMSGRQIVTRPIKGTRPRSDDADEDARLAYELQSSEKERAELVMITDLLRNDLGRVCEFGSVRVPDLMRLERYAQVQHLVSTIEGLLRREVTHFEALASCFPGGSITGAPKVRAMEIIDELEAIARGPYTGCIGYLGFNRESQLNIAIRTAVRTPEAIHFHVGAGIVADSDPEMEYEETLAKGAGFEAAIRHCSVTGRTEPSAAHDRSDSRRS